MTATTRGVSIFSRQRRRKADVFDMAQSPDGVVMRRPGRADQRLAWDRVSQWEIGNDRAVTSRRPTAAAR